MKKIFSNYLLTLIITALVFVLIYFNLGNKLEPPLFDLIIFAIIVIMVPAILPGLVLAYRKREGLGYKRYLADILIWFFYLILYYIIVVFVLTPMN